MSTGGLGVNILLWRCQESIYLYIAAAVDIKSGVSILYVGGPGTFTERPSLTQRA